MRRGFISLLFLFIVIGIIDVGVASTILISKKVDTRGPSEKVVAKETSEALKTLEDSIPPPVLQQPTEKLKTRVQISASETAPVQTNILAPDVPSSEDIALTKPEAVIEEAPLLPQTEQIASCENDTKPKLTADITDFSKIRKITAPSILTIEGPKGYSFISTSNRRVPVYAPAAITFTSGSYSKDTADSPAYYVLFFVVKENCNYQVKFGHIDEPVASIVEQLPNTPTIGNSNATEVSNKIEFNAGDLIGYTSGTAAGNWDFGLYNTKEKGVLAVEHNSYGPHGYAVCWTDFYTPDAKKQQYRQLLEGPTVVCIF
ncbi:MAG: hypothetical protein Q8R36_05005 [bacterium]|nr:hypothetical protein [bacterium]